MKACGLVVEYNPFHHGHHYHLQAAQYASSADCIIATMSGNFLQRGEPAIIDKFHRAKAAVESGVDIVVELPYIYAVQNSDLFAKGAVLTLAKLGVSSLCFGSEHGEIEEFLNSYQQFDSKQSDFQIELKKHLSAGLSFPEASRKAYEAIDLQQETLNLTKPNNILGFSYIKAIYESGAAIKPLTIKRINNDFHDTEIDNPIASATSIRKELIKEDSFSSAAASALPNSSIQQLNVYKQKAGIWHNWEPYFPLLRYRVLTMSEAELAQIHGVEEGLEYRIKRTAKTAVSFQMWMETMKTKRYTWTRIQRTFVHILLHIKKQSISDLLQSDQAPYIRLLGMSDRGRNYLNKRKKELDIPLISQVKKEKHPMLEIDLRAADVYYSILSPANREELYRQEFLPPYMMHNN